MKVLPWETLNSQTAYEGPIFTVRKDQARSELSGKEHTFDILECPRWVNVIALTSQGELVLIKQFRQGTGNITTEIPGGAIDAGEEPLKAAQRELMEETGYTSDEWESLGVVEPNPAFQTNTTYTFLARAARKTSEPQPDENEEIEVFLRTLRDIPQMLRDGSITHSLVYCAFAHLALRGELELADGSHQTSPVG